MSDELKPCPFCGGEGIRYSYDISCKECGAMIGVDDDVPAAIAAWNRRPEPEPAAEEAGDKPKAADILRAVRLNERVHALEKWAEQFPKDQERHYQAAADKVNAAIGEFIGDINDALGDKYTALEARLATLERVAGYGPRAGQGFGEIPAGERGEGEKGG